MNFVMLKTGMNLVGKKVARGTEFFKYLAQHGAKKLVSWSESGLQIVQFTQDDYLGYARRKPAQLLYDLLFSRTFLKQMKDFVCPAFTKLLTAMAANDFPAGAKLRQQGEMMSLILPDTGCQKVLLFCRLPLQNLLHQAYVLIDVGDAREWNKHGRAWSKRNDFRQKAGARQRYYEPIYRQSLSIED